MVSTDPPYHLTRSFLVILCLMFQPKNETLCHAVRIHHCVHNLINECHKKTVCSLSRTLISLLFQNSMVVNCKMMMWLRAKFRGWLIQRQRNLESKCPLYFWYGWINRKLGRE